MPIKMRIYKKRSLYSETTFFKTHFVDYDEKIRTSSCFSFNSISNSEDKIFMVSATSVQN